MGLGLLFSLAERGAGSCPAPFASKRLFQHLSQVQLLLFVGALGGSWRRFAGFLLTQPLCLARS